MSLSLKEIEDGENEVSEDKDHGGRDEVCKQPQPMLIKDTAQLMTECPRSTAESPGSHTFGIPQPSSFRLSALRRMAGR